MDKGKGSAQGRVWFITGASSGFGRAVSKAVPASGGRVVATARDLAELKASIDDGEHARAF